jgi:hypothetical protein
MWYAQTTPETTEVTTLVVSSNDDRDSRLCELQYTPLSQTRLADIQVWRTMISVRLGSPSSVLRPNTNRRLFSSLYLPLQVTDHVRLVLECDILYGPLTSVVTRFLFRLLQRFSFLLPTECLLLFGCHVPGFWIFP